MKMILKDNKGEQMENRRRIGIMGGTFNPIHMGHFILAKDAKEQFHLNNILFIPAKCPYHKEITDPISDYDRIKMVQLAIENEPDFQLNLMEFDRDGNTYTIDTLNELENIYENTQFYFIMGADSLFQFLTWKQPEEILRKAIILVGIRNNKKIEELKQQIKLIIDTIGYGTFHIINNPNIDISSHEIRNKIKNKLSIQSLVSENVYQYIKKNRLYE